MRVERTETKIILRDILRTTAPMVVSGRICKPGTLVEFDAVDAEGLLFRRVAVRASESEVKKGPVLSAPRSNLAIIQLAHG